MKNQYILMISLVFLIMSLSFVSGVTSVISPVRGGNYTGTMALNCTTALPNALNATFYYSTSGTSTHLSTKLATITNDTSNDVYFYSASQSISAISDLATYNFTCWVNNQTDSENTTTARWTITIDNTAPDCTSSVQKKNIEPLTSNTLSCACTDTIDGSPTIWRQLTKPTKDKVAYTSDASTAMGTNINQIGSYGWDCSSRDYTGNIVNETQLVFYAKGAMPVSATGEPLEKATGIPISIISIIAGVVVIFIIIVIAIVLKGG